MSFFELFVYYWDLFGLYFPSRRPGYCLQKEEKTVFRFLCLELLLFKNRISIFVCGVHGCVSCVHFIEEMNKSVLYSDLYFSRLYNP